VITILSYLGMIVKAHFNKEDPFSLVFRLVTADLHLSYLRHKGIWQSLYNVRLVKLEHHCSSFH